MDDPLLVDWLDPNGEVGPFGNFHYWDFSEANRRNFVRYLRDGRAGTRRRALGEAWHGDRRRFRSWDDVPIPHGLRPLRLEAGQHPGRPTVARASGSRCGKRPGGLVRAARRLPAVGPGRHRPGLREARLRRRGWAAFDLPGGELASIFWRANSTQFWYRGTLTVPGEVAAGEARSGRVYLTAAPLTNARGWKNPDRLWVNGQERPASAPARGRHHRPGGRDRPAAGGPQLAGVPAGPTPASGCAARSSSPRGRGEDFPFRDPHRRPLSRDWHEYIRWCVMDMMENTFKAIRAVDPDRFIKMHAAEDKHLGIPLQARYGCFGHNTGEGGFFRPWDKRFGYPYGVPASAEFGGYVDTDAAV